MPHTNSKLVDLHCHTSSSGGAMGTPMAAAAYFKRKGYAAFSLTEHCNFESLQAGQQAAQEEGVEFMPGIEMTVSVNDGTIQQEAAHFLCFDYAVTKPVSQYASEAIERERAESSTFLSRLKKKGIVDITEEDLVAHIRERFGQDDAWKRPYSVGPIGDLLKKRGVIPHDAPGNNTVRAMVREECADLQLPPHPDVGEVSQAFKEAGAVCIVAHPYGEDTPADEAQRQRLEHWLDRYADGIEMYRSYRNPPYEALIAEIVCRRKRPFTGGSDTHTYGDNVDKISRAPYACLQSIREFKETGRAEEALSAIANHADLS